MAPGLGFVRDAIIDQHFAERGCIGRLLGAVAQNPRVIGIGIDEDTAILLRDDALVVLGSGAVYIVDGVGVAHSNIAEDGWAVGGDGRECVMAVSTWMKGLH